MPACIFPAAQFPPRGSATVSAQIGDYESSGRTEKVLEADCVAQKFCCCFAYSIPRISGDSLYLGLPKPASKI